MGQETLAVLVPDVKSLLVLVKSTLKACCLSQEDHTKLVNKMLLTPVGPGKHMLNLLEVRHGSVAKELYVLHRILASTVCCWHVHR